MPIKDFNKRNYYINLSVERNLSSRELEKEIKSNSYERLVNKPSKIEIINATNNISFLDNMKNPIIIKVDENKKIGTGKYLETTILAQLTFILTQFGKGYNSTNLKNFRLFYLLYSKSPTLSDQLT